MKSKKSFSLLKVGKGVRAGSGKGVAVGVKVGAEVGVKDGVGRIGVKVGNRVTVGLIVGTTAEVWLVAEQPAKMTKRNIDGSFFIIISIPPILPHS
jgi:hypothetical protein